MSNTKKFKMQRALGLELPGLGKPGALEKRNYPPGQHGRDNAKRKLSEYGAQLKEKQKLLFHYGLREEQLRRFVRDARRIQASNWVESLIGLLERRLDNVVFRLGFARSMAAARQLVSHGHVMVNGRILTIGSAVLRVGDFVKLTEYAASMKATVESRLAPRLPLPGFLQFAHEGVDDHGVVRMQPGAAHVPFTFDPQQIAEYYAKLGV
ncbi:30S ribosomal protein S4 [Edaphobacter flagellatus]|uniref:30S ribosomal protein S4 n=1 Tax=Edaphobacter flagellatus TaxID=1933044 RepID=UPI0021B31BDD|nr:30S ribosomal protein S4 [Edaphobacter flagellatus]